jgi:tetratricopeptide (TPR) repeat protein
MDPDEDKTVAEVRDALVAVLNEIRGGGLPVVHVVESGEQDATNIVQTKPGLETRRANTMYANLGLALHDKKRLAEAMACYDMALEAVGRRDARTLNNLGAVKLAQRDFEGARLLFAEALALDANCLQANTNLTHLEEVGWPPVLYRRAGIESAFEDERKRSVDRRQFPVVRYGQWHQLVLFWGGAWNVYTVLEDASPVGGHILRSSTGSEFPLSDLAGQTTYSVTSPFADIGRYVSYSCDALPSVAVVSCIELRFTAAADGVLGAATRDAINEELLKIAPSAGLESAGRRGRSSIALSFLDQVAADIRKQWSAKQLQTTFPVLCRTLTDQEHPVLGEEACFFVKGTKEQFDAHKAAVAKDSNRKCTVRVSGLHRLKPADEGVETEIEQLQGAGILVARVRLSSVDIRTKRMPSDAQSTDVLLGWGGVSCIELVRYNYAQGQELRVWRAVGQSWANESADNIAHDALPNTPHAVALLPPASIDSEHKRFSAGLRERYSTFIDAFSGDTLDLKTQTATVQYQRGDKRASMLREFKDYDDVGAATHGQPFGIDASELLKYILAEPVVWESGNFGSQPCALVVGPAASGKTTLMRRFIVDALDAPGSIVPVFLAVIDLVHFVDAARKNSRSITDECITSLSNETGALQLFLAQAVAERRVLFLIDGMDEAGAVRDAVENFVAEELIGRGHRVVVSSRQSGFSNKLQRVFESDKHQVVQLLPLNEVQQRSMVRARLKHEQQAVESFMAQVRNTRLVELAENPLMLTMMLATFKRLKGQLPAKRSELYEEAIGAMFDRVDAARKQHGGSLQELRAFVQELAFLSHRRQGGQFRTFTAAQASGGLHEVDETQQAMSSGTEPGTKWGDVVGLMRSRLGFPIIVSLGTAGGDRGEEDEWFRFSHLTFQEYLAACELVGRFADSVRRECSSDQLSAVLRAVLLLGEGKCAAHALDDPRWHLVLEVSAELCDAKGWKELFARAMLVGCGEKLVLGAELRVPGATVLGNLLLAMGRTTLSTLEIDRVELPVAELQTATKMDFSRRQLQPAHAIIIAKLLCVVDAPLTKLNLANNSIGIEGAKAIAAVLPSAHLKNLNLARNEIGVEGANAIAAVLPDAPLTKLTLNFAELSIKKLKTAASCDLSNKNLKPTDAIVIASLMSMANTPLKTLNLEYNEIGIEGAKAIAAALANAPLTDLNLTSNKIGDEGVKAIVAVLPSASLTTLMLKRNPIGDEGRMAIAAGLSNTALTKLSYGDRPAVSLDTTAKSMRLTPKDATDARIIAAFLPRCALCTSLNLLKTGIGKAAADIVCAAEQHGKIQTLCGIKPDQEEADFSEQRLEAADAILLAYDIKANTQLASLRLGTNSISVEGAKAIAAALPR